MEQTEEIYLRPTSIIDSDHKEVISYAESHLRDCGDDPVDQAVRLFYAVRDGIRYTPYYPFYLQKHYRASCVLAAGCGYCVPKASLLCALGRSCGIPSRIGFVHIRNHQTPRQLLEYMGTDLFTCHGYNEFFLDKRWVKATVAFNEELCLRFGIDPIEFDGIHDSMLPARTRDNQPFIDYVEKVGIFDDIPVDLILKSWEEAYGAEKVKAWKESFEKAGGVPEANADNHLLY